MAMVHCPREPCPLRILRREYAHWEVEDCQMGHVLLVLFSGDHRRFSANASVSQDASYVTLNVLVP